VADYSYTSALVGVMQAIEQRIATAEEFGDLVL